MTRFFKPCISSTPTSGIVQYERFTSQLIIWDWSWGYFNSPRTFFTFDIRIIFKGGGGSCSLSKRDRRIKSFFENFVFGEEWGVRDGFSIRYVDQDLWVSRGGFYDVSTALFFSLWLCMGNLCFRSRIRGPGEEEGDYYPGCDFKLLWIYPKRNIAGGAMLRYARRRLMVCMMRSVIFSYLQTIWIPRLPKRKLSFTHYSPALFPRNHPLQSTRVEHIFSANAPDPKLTPKVTLTHSSPPSPYLWVVPEPGAREARMNSSPATYRRGRVNLAFQTHRSPPPPLKKKKYPRGRVVWFFFKHPFPLPPSPTPLHISESKPETEAGTERRREPRIKTLTLNISSMTERGWGFLDEGRKAETRTLILPLWYNPQSTPDRPQRKNPFSLFPGGEGAHSLNKKKRKK